MAGNKLIEKEEELNERPEGGSEETSAPKKAKKKSTFNLNRAMNLFGIFERNQIVDAMPYILFVTMLIIGYIANSYYAERVIRKIDKTKYELKERRAEYISSMSRLMYQSKQSEVAKALQPVEIEESTEPPREIYVETQKEK